MTCSRGKKGQRPFAMVLRENLWDWFVDIRSAVLTSISPQFILRQARAMAGSLLQEMALKGYFIRLPVIDTRWMRRFLKHYRISLRQPNRRYKVSRALGDARCVAEWTNVFKIRRLAEIYLKNDLSTKMVQVDEKPIHVNESGSKAVKTLEHEGAPFVALRTNHSASRDRLTLVTCPGRVRCWLPTIANLQLRRALKPSRLTGLKQSGCPRIQTSPLIGPRPGRTTGFIFCRTSSVG